MSNMNSLTTRLSSFSNNIIIHQELADDSVDDDVSIIRDIVRRPALYAYPGK